MSPRFVQGYTGRRPLPHAVIARCLVLNVPDFSTAEFALILRPRVAARFPDVAPEQAAAVAEFMVQHVGGADVTLRHYIKWLRRMDADALVGDWQDQLRGHARVLFPASQPDPTSECVRIEQVWDRLGPADEGAPVRVESCRGRAEA